MAINFSKSCCIRVGPRCDKSCANISSKTGSNIPWVTEMRYLWVYFVQVFEMFVNCRQARFLSGSQQYLWYKIERFASEEVILQLISSKCIPILLYGQEVLPMQKYQLNSLDFVINRFFIKLFKTSNIRIV